MLSDPASVTEETIDIQAYCVRNTRFNSRKVSGGGTLLDDLAHLPGRLRVLWGEGDDSQFRPADLLIGEIRAAVGALDLHRIPKAGHWSAYENAPEVNRRMLEFFSVLKPDRARPARRRGGGSTMDGMPPRPRPPGHMPMTRAELDARGIDAPDVVFVTGDAYVDHPVVRHGHPRAVCSKRGLSRRHPRASPTGRACEPWRALGRPRLFFGVSAGNMDSMINHYTANRKVAQRRRLLAGRPHRAAARPGDARLLPALPRGVSRRAGHRRRRRSLAAPARALRLLERHGPPLDAGRLSKADLLVLRHGRARHPSRSPTARRRRGRSRPARHAGRGLCCWARARRRRPTRSSCRATRTSRAHARRTARLRGGHAHDPPRDEPLQRAPPGPAPRRPAVVVNPPAMPLAEREMDAVYGLPYTRTPHPSYTEADPGVRR